MVQLQADGAHLHIRVVCEHGKERLFNIDGFVTLGVDTNAILDPMVQYLNLLSATSARLQASRIQWLADALVELKVRQLPQTELAWSRLFLDIHRFFLTRNDSKASIRTRLETWADTLLLLEKVQENDVFPISTYLPPCKRLEAVDISSYRDQLLGQSPAEEIKAGTVDKLLVSVEIGKQDAAYLENIRDELARRRKVLRDVLGNYWSKIRANYEFGKELIASVDWDNLVQRCKAYRYTKDDLHPADYRRGLEGLANSLAISINGNNSYLITQADRRPTSWQKENRETPTVAEYNFPSSNFGFAGGSREALFEHVISDSRLPPNFVTKERMLVGQPTELHQALNWMIGSLSLSDVTVICSLLIMLNPKFTPSSILNAKVHDNNENEYLIETDGQWSFSVEKKRVKAMKTAGLDPLSVEIISTIIEMTEVRRAYLKEQRHSAANLLFLPVSILHNKLAAGKTTLNNQILTGCNQTGTWLGDYYPELEKNGLARATITASKIRTTEGVLEWFRTGSVTAMSKKLGNTQKVVLTHYLPKPLINAWNTRLIRRFQNLWISVAAANEPFLLDVTDFNSLADLHIFLTDMLQLHVISSSPLGSELHERFSFLITDDISAEKSEGSLEIAISTNTLTTLYSYFYAAINAGLSREQMDAIDPRSGLSPRYFIDLSQFLIKALPKHNMTEFRHAHDNAQAIAIAKSSSLGWERFFVTKG